MRSLKFQYLWRYLRSFVQRYILQKEIDRQPYFIAHITNPAALYLFLLKNLDYQDNYFALVDKGELFNIRRYSFVPIIQIPATLEDERWQLHIHIFADEVRGHFEISYEEDAVRHYNGSTICEISGDALAELLHAIEESQDTSVNELS